jgi:hypothetical protein
MYERHITRCSPRQRRSEVSELEFRRNKIYWGMNKAIVAYHKDEENHWVAELVCGHFQHVRNNPPGVNRSRVESKAGRDSMLGRELGCKKCDTGAPPDKVST